MMAYSSTATASGSETVLRLLVEGSMVIGEAGLAGAGTESGEFSCCSSSAWRDSCLEVKMLQGPATSSVAGKCSAGRELGAEKGGSGTGALPPLAMER